MKAQDIEMMVKAALPDAVIDIKDLAGDGDHFAIVVTSGLFQGRTRIEQHRMVFDALRPGGGMGKTLHALQVTTKISA